MGTKGIRHYLHGLFGAAWMVNMMDKLQVAGKTVDYVAKFDESSRAFLAQRCTNSRGRFLMIAVSRVFQAVVDSFVAVDKAKHQIAEDRSSGEPKIYVQPGRTLSSQR